MIRTAADRNGSSEGVDTPALEREIATALVIDARDGNVDQPEAVSWGAPVVRDGVHASRMSPAPSLEGSEQDFEAERDKWRERAVVWRERALAAEVVAKELGAHLADVKENLEDVRLAVRTVSDHAAAARQLELPRTGWRAYVARLLDLD